MSQTLRRELKQAISKVINQRAISEYCPEVVIDELVDAALEVAGIAKRNLSVEESANRTVDGILAFEAKGQTKLAPRAAMWDRADKELARIQYNLSGARQAEQERFTSFLIAEEKKGRSIEQFVSWALGDEFWVGKVNSLNKIMELWLRQDAPAEPEVETYQPEELKPSPMPEEIRKKLHAKFGPPPQLRSNQD